MAVRKEVKIIRRCGYRQVGGLYMVGKVVTFKNCDRLPFWLRICECCGGGFKFSRTLVKTKASLLFGGLHKPDSGKCTCDVDCPVCFPDDKVSAIMWVGREFYTPTTFIGEALKMGVSKRINRRSTFVELGKTRIFLAHIDGGKDEQGEPVPAVFASFTPSRYEKVMTESQLGKYLAKNPNYVDEWDKVGVDICVVPDNDKDHQTPKQKPKKKSGISKFGANLSNNPI